MQPVSEALLEDFGYEARNQEPWDCRKPSSSSSSLVLVLDSGVFSRTKDEDDLPAWRVRLDEKPTRTVQPSQAGEDARAPFQSQRVRQKK